MKLLLIILCCLGIGTATAQQTADRPITRATMYGVGYTNVFDTYLSPQEYKGVEVRISRESMRMMRFADGNWSRQIFFQGNLGYTHNHVDNNNMISALVNWSYALHHHFALTENFKLLAGGLVDLNGGFAYNLRNGNNPAQARAYANLCASGMAVWKLQLKRMPLTLRYQLNVPVLGVMFMPNYGQSYYEIFSVGHWSGVINFTSLHNQPSLRQMLTVDFPVRKAKLRLGYICDLQQAKVNDIKTHTYSHAFMVGFVKEFSLLKGAHPKSAL